MLLELCELVFLWRRRGYMREREVLLTRPFRKLGYSCGGIVEAIEY